MSEASNEVPEGYILEISANLLMLINKWGDLGPQHTALFSCVFPRKDRLSHSGVAGYPVDDICQKSKEGRIHILFMT